MSDADPIEMTYAELAGGLPEPIFGSGAELALLHDDPMEYQEALLRQTDEASNAAQDNFLARKVALMEAAGVPSDEIVNMLVAAMVGDE